MDNDITISNLDGIENQLLQLKKEDISSTQLMLIGFQLKAISSIRENTLTLSFIDSLINYQHICDFDEIRTESLRHQSHLLVSHLIFFHKSSLEYEKASLKKENERLLVNKYDIYKSAISSVGDTIEMMLLLTVQSNKISIDKEKLRESILQVHKKSFSMLDAIVNLFRDQKIMQEKINEIVKLENEFNRIIPLLIHKLHQNIETFGKSALITGLIENYRQILISEPIQKIIRDSKPPSQKRTKFNNPFNKLNEAVITIGILIITVFFIFFIIYLISLIFGDGKNIINWISSIWDLKYWGIGILAICYSVVTVLWFSRKKSQVKLKKIYKEEYTKDQEVYFSLIKKQTRRIYDKYNTIYKDFHPYSKELPFSYSEETNDIFDKD